MEKPSQQVRNGISISKRDSRFESVEAPIFVEYNSTSLLKRS